MLKQIDTLIGFAVVMSMVSLLITIITQMISAILGLRGLNLADSLIVMIDTIEPKIPTYLRRQLVDHILTRPVISDSMMSMSESWADKVPLLSWFRKRWKRASAIRPDELLSILRRLTEVPTLIPRMPPQPQAQLPPQHSSAVGQTREPPPRLQQTQIQTLEDAATAILNRLAVAGDTTAAAITTLNAALPGLLEARGAAFIHEAAGATNVVLVNLERWFNSAQNRAQQWFAIHTRVWTVIAAVGMAFALQLDAFQLVTQLSNDSELRARLLSASSTIKDQADKVFTNTLSLAAINRDALRQLKNSEGAKIDEPPADLDTTAKAERWLTNELGTNNSAADRLLPEFGRIVQDKSKERFNQARGQFAGVTDAFSKARFQLMPDPYPGIGEWSWPFPHLLGIMASVALLSLGAPFWFNMLKSLTNLRPMLASEVDKDPTQLPTKSGGTA